jgi:protein SCO1/2
MTTFIDKRNFLLGAAAAMAGLGFMAAKQSQAVQLVNKPWREQLSPREAMRQKNFPNVPLITHEGKEVMFYDDLIKDKKVAINMMYTSCNGICGPSTRNIIEARELLGDFGKDIHFYSISLTPLHDDPAALRAYMQRFGITSEWTFLTGKPENVELVRRGLGFASSFGNEDEDISSHAGMMRVGNEPMASWGHVSTRINGRAAARMIRFELTA